MAEGQPLTPRSFKEQFDDQLTCSVCLDQYTDPKTLPCHHSFCLKCIEHIPLEIKDGNEYINCPTCRVEHVLPQGRAINLPNAFHINSLLDLRKTLDADQNVYQKLPTTDTPPMDTNSTCSKHNDNLTVYCGTCDQAICRDCALSKEHNKHEYQLISECYAKHRYIILENLIKFKRTTAEIDKAVILLDMREKQVFEQGESLKEQINTFYTQKLNDNKQEKLKIHLTQQVDKIVQQKMQTLAAQKQQAKKLHTQLETSQDMFEKRFKRLDQQQLLIQKTTMIDEMNTAAQNINSAVFQPIEEADINLEKKGDVSIIKSKTYGKATLEVLCCATKQPSTATLTLHSLDGSPFSLTPSLIASTLSSPHDKHSIKCTVTQILPGRYNIIFTPSTKKDQLIVQVGGVDVPNSPFVLPVIPALEMSGEPVNIITGLNQPWGIAVCDNGDIAITEKGTQCVKLISVHHYTHSFNIGNTNLAGIAISMDGHILVTENHQLKKLTADGKSVGSIKSGSGQLQFNYPMGIAVHPITGDIFVADSLNNRIQVFENDLTFSETISLGLFHSFKTPCDIAIDSNGEYLYVIEYNNHCITKLTSKGKYIKRFSSHGSAPGQLSHPFFLAIHEDIIYVTDSGNNRVSIFNTNGRFIAESKIKPDKPRGIATDKHGNLYIVDFKNGEILRTI